MSKTTQIVDAYGRPVEMNVLREEVAAASLTGLRTPWWQDIASTLDPGILAGILQSVDQGEAWQYLVLAYSLEDRYPHYYSVLSTRKMAVSGLTLNIEPATDEAEDVKIADFVREALDQEITAPMVLESMDALSKGYSCLEIMWDTSEGQWWPREFLYRDARWFRYDLPTGQELRILDMKDPAFGIPLPPYKFLKFEPKIKAGLPIKRGLARLALSAYMIQNYGLRDWLAFSETMGIPLRLGKYPTTATTEERQALFRAVSGIGADAAGIVPNTMDIVFENRGTVSGGDKIFQGLCEHTDKMVSKAVLGQTATTEGTPGKLGNEKAQENVREDIRTSDSGQMAAALKRDVVRPIVDLNFGPRPRGRYPNVTLITKKPEDLEKLGKALGYFVDRGMRVEESWAREKFGAPEPEAGALTLQPQNRTDPPPMPPGTDVTPNLPEDDNPTSDNPDDQEKKAYERARAVRAEAVATLTAKVVAGEVLTDDQRRFLELAAEAPMDQVERLAARALPAWRGVMDPMLEPIALLAERCKTAEEFRAELAALDLDTSKLTETIARMTFTARGIGDATDKP